MSSAHSPRPNQQSSSSPPSTPKADWRSLFCFVGKQHYLVLTLGLIFSVLTSIIIPAFAYLLGKVFNAFTNYGAGRTDIDTFLGQAAQYTLYMTALGLVNLGLSGIFLFLWLLFGELQAQSARHALYTSLMDKKMEWYDTHEAGISASTTRIQSQLHELRAATSQSLGFLCQYSGTILAALGLAFYSAWDLALVVIASAPVGGLILSILSKKLQPHIQRQATHLEACAKHASAALNAVATVQCANGQDFELRQYMDCVKAAAKEYLHQARLNALQMGFIRFLTLAIFVQGFWYGSHLVRSGDRDPGQVLTAFWSCLIATQTFEGLFQHMLVLEKGCVAASLLRSITTDAATAQKEEKSGSRPRHCDGDIIFDKVSFAYPSSPEKPVLNELTMFLPARETVVIIGKSGSGKSTLSSLLLGFYSIASGRLTIDGKSIDTLDRSWLRNNITVMQQQSVLFNGSIAENIALARIDSEKVSLEAIEGCIDGAVLKDTIMSLPKGLHTAVGFGGSMMSGGQRQRISFARTRLRDTPILIFDEATSALDQPAATALMKSIRQWRRGKTTIIITHDLAQVLNDDYVLVMEHGKVIQEGYLSSLKTIHHGLGQLISPNQDQLEPLPKIPIQQHSDITHIIDSGDYSHRLSHNRGAPANNTNFHDHWQGKNNSATVEALETSLPQWKALSSTRKAQRSSIQLSSRHSLVPARFEIESLPQESELAPGVTRFVMNPTNKAEPDRNPTDRPLSENKAAEVSKARQRFLLHKIVATIWPHLDRSERILFVTGLVATFGHALATPVFSWVFSKLIGTYMSNGANGSQASLEWSLAVLAVAISDGILSFLMHYLLGGTGQYWVDALRQKAYRAILYQPLSWFDCEKENTQSLTGCLDKCGEEARNLVGRFLGLLLVAAVMSIVAIIWSLVLCWQLTLVCLACGPFVYALVGLFDKVNTRWEARYNAAAQSVSDSFSETFGNIRTVRALTLEKYFHQKNFKMSRKVMQIGIKRAIYSGIFFGTSDTAILSVIALLFWYSSKLVAYHGISVEAILTVLSMLLFTLTSVISMVSFIPQLNASQDAANRLLGLVKLDAPLSSLGILTPQRTISLSGSIKVNKLNFTYPSRPQRAAIRDLSCDIPLSTSTAIVGASGSGKTTFLSLLMGHYATRSSMSAIRIASYSLCEIDMAYLRGLMALSPQNPAIFPVSVKANIAYALPAASALSSMNNIIRAAELAGIHAFISSLPRGYDTLIGEGGGSLLSGGQMARIGLARALCRRPKILVLDEPTASLDGPSRTELVAVIQQLVNEGVTVIVATHDRILQEGCRYIVQLAP